MDIAAVVTIVSGIVSVAAIISSPVNTWIRYHYDKQLQQTERFFKARSSTYPPYIEAVSLYLRHPSAEQHTQTERAAAAAELFASIETLELISDLQRQISESLLHLSSGFIDDAKILNDLSSAYLDMILSMQNDLKIPSQKRR